MRSKTSKVFAWLIVVILVIGLAGFGIQDVIRSSGNNYIAKFGDQKVSPEDYVRAIQQEINFLSTQLGSQISFEQAKSLGASHRALQNLLSSMVLNQLGDDLGISRSDKAVISEIQQNRAFLNIGGEFDKEKYSTVLKRINLQPREYEEMVRDDLTRNIIISATQTEDPVPLDVINLMTKYILEERIVEIVSFNAKDLELNLTEPSNDAIADFYKENAELFRKPPGRKVSYIYLTPEELSTDQIVSEEEIEEAFKINGASYSSSEKRDIDQIFFMDSESARNFFNSGKALEDEFETVIAERGLLAEDISLGEVEQSDLEAAAKSEVFASPELGIFGPYQTEVGYVIYRVNHIIPAESLSNNEVKKLIKKDIALRKSETELLTISTTIENELAAGVSLEEIAGATKMLLGNIEIYPNLTLPAPINVIEFIEAANSADEYPSNLISSENGLVFAVRLDAEIDGSTSALEEVRSEIVDKLKSFELSEKLEELGKNIVLKVEDKKLMEHKFNYLPSAKKETKLSRFKISNNLTDDTINTIFELNEMDIAIDVGGSTLNLIQHIKTIEPSLEDQDAKVIKEQITSDYKASLNKDLINTMLSAFQKKYDMEINQNMINSTIGRFE